MPNSLEAGAVQYSANAYTANSAVSGSSNHLGDRDAFMELLLMQMRSQDPMNPMDSAQFFNQLSQLSMLEQLWQINDSLSSSSVSQQLAQGASLIGRHVEANNADTGRISGLVEQVRMVSNQVWLQIGDEEVQLSDVLSVQ